MGQKVNPIGLRLGYIKGWDSSWFENKKRYSEKLIEDEKIRIYVYARIPKGGIVVFDEAIMNSWPGEALALNEVLGIGNHRLVRMPNIKQFYLIKE